MPHLTLEYTANLGEWAAEPELLISLHRLLESAAGIKIENCKSRWRMVDEWVTGDGKVGSAFVHLDVRFLEGRPPEVKHAVGAGAVELLHDHFALALDGPDPLEVQITVEIQDIQRASYFKYPPGTLGPPSLSLV
ncbi:MAG: 5-carboxymethyl-2-hydroxymuconate isomerase [Gemmatimonadetes bacterium]|nr:5-carboxymethyl-2-hydroxymuconate isomerase [Gemmatimonadota bacterium]NNM06621.1 5-carboxymethyl-2-hydroxymuconate isomerase [Gemmatimonadota bacterium]